ncbi:hypothetical protein VF04_35065 [Nostoc linckia z7]|uniref:Uncharacterized protein n=1 Tax=Nostoc linckia z7 TaxID=1628745 RepID=A0ABX4KEJ6_NOSLI|nr:hypothetical protein VF02_37095 [Nostoc linckia z1]PHJ59284.1 hypothetical protein VF05_32340 [Nostoc linckia z3]PHJ63679.1 hypothetical protein VF03_30215 [Nostoc linckia z2]PHJ73859.1 hypothetical protein VF06_35675 [Nostoc linckia z4]PHJ87200.1 hypothetical protein VF04_35065 [Nostoc linckia z7]
MKRFFLFAADTHYPNGGMIDFVRDFDSAEEAKSFWISIRHMYRWDEPCWHIWDNEKFIIVEGRDYGREITNETLEQCSLWSVDPVKIYSKKGR